MKRMSWKLMCAVLSAARGGSTVGEAAAPQSFGGGLPSLGASGCGMAPAWERERRSGRIRNGRRGAVSPVVQTMPSGMPLFSPTVPDAAAILTGAAQRLLDAGESLQQPDGRAVPLQQHAPGRRTDGRDGSSGATARPARPADRHGRRERIDGRSHGPAGMRTTQLGMLMLLANAAERRDRLGPAQRRPGTIPAAGRRPRVPPPARATARRPARRPGRPLLQPKRPAHTAYPQSYFNRQAGR